MTTHDEFVALVEERNAIKAEELDLIQRKRENEAKLITRALCDLLLFEAKLFDCKLDHSALNRAVRRAR